MPEFRLHRSATRHPLWSTYTGTSSKASLPANVRANRFKELRRSGITKFLAAVATGSPQGSAPGGSKSIAQPNLRLSRFAPPLHCKLKLNPVETPRCVTCRPRGVGGAAPRGVPLSRSWARGRSPRPCRRISHNRPGSRIAVSRLRRANRCRRLGQLVDPHAYSASGSFSSLPVPSVSLMSAKPRFS